MSAPELMTELASRGIRLTGRGDRLAYDAPAGTMTPDLAERVKRHKPELLALLAAGVEPAAGEQLEKNADRERVISWGCAGPGRTAAAGMIRRRPALWRPCPGLAHSCIPRKHEV